MTNEQIVRKPILSFEATPTDEYEAPTKFETRWSSPSPLCTRTFGTQPVSLASKRGRAGGSEKLACMVRSLSRPFHNSFPGASLLRSYQLCLDALHPIAGSTVHSGRIDPGGKVAFLLVNPQRETQRLSSSFFPETWNTTNRIETGRESRIRDGWRHITASRR